jgi:hypothetical protein
MTTQTLVLEPDTKVHWLSGLLIGAGLSLFALDRWRASRARRRAMPGPWIQDGEEPFRSLPRHPSEWRGTWYRPVRLDEDSHDPLTVARMTDHNVRGG